MKNWKLLFITGSVLLAGCIKKDQKASGYTYELEVLKRNYALILGNEIDDFTEATQLMVQRTIEFTSIPIATKFNLLRTTFIDYSKAYSRYLLIEDEAPLFLDYYNQSSPLYSDYIVPGFIDYTVADANGGAVNNTTLLPVINTATIKSIENRPQRKRLTGFAPIEFLLWGEDFSLTQPGQRSHQDYSTHPARERRKLLLRSMVQSDAENIYNLKTLADKNTFLSKSPMEFYQSFSLAFQNYLKIDIAERGIEAPINLSNSTADYDRTPFGDFSIQLLQEMIGFGLYLVDHEDPDDQTNYWLRDLFNDLEKGAGDEIYERLSTLNFKIMGIEANMDQIKAGTDKSNLLNIASELKSIASEIESLSTKIKGYR